MNRHFTRFLSLLICALMIFGMLPVYAETANTPAIRIYLSDAGENLNVHTPLQTAFIDGPYENVNLYAGGTAELSRPAPILLTWQVVRKSSVSLPSRYYIKVTENPDMTGGYDYSTTETKAEIYNLKPGTRYYWQISATVNGVTYTSEPSTFSTDDRLPYNFLIGGVTNVRDLGGYPTSDGGRVKFGMVYRTGQLNVGGQTTPLINAQGIATMRNELHIRSEIDLRAVDTNEYGGRTTSTLGADVNYYLCPMGYSGNVLESSNYASIKKVFNYLGNESNYPIIYHCAIGTDRTGLISYLINGLLGVSENDLFRDYLFSNFGNIGGPRQPSQISKIYPIVLKKYYGATLSEKIYNYLNREVGISTTTLDNVIAILKEYPEEPPRTEIYSADQLRTMDPDGDYVLTADLNVNSTFTRKFTGSIDGAGHTVTTSVPLFTNFSGKIKNLTVEGNVVTSGTNAAALTLTTSGMKVENVTNNASVTLLDNSGDFCAGGFAAKANVGDVYFLSCTNNADVTAYGTAGGFIALCSGELSMTGCVNNGSVTATKAANCGGFAAETAGGFHMEKCFNFGDVTGSGDYTAGLVSRVYENEGFPTLKTLASVGNYGDVTGGIYTSGLIGQIAASAGSLTYSYNLGNIRGGANASYVTGLVANFNNTSFNISRCYNAGNITAENGARRLQLFHSGSTAIDTNYLYRDYALSEIDVPAFCYKNSSGQYVDQNAVSGNATAIPFSPADLFSGNLRTAVNGSVAVYSQIANHASMTDIVDEDLIMTGTQRIYGKFYSFDENGAYIGTLANNYTGLYTENGTLYYAENGVAVTGWKTVDGNTYYFAPTALTGRQVIDGKTYNFDENGILVTEQPIEQEGVYAENYVLTIENAQDINFVRIAEGILNTSADIKNAADCIHINEDIITANTDADGSFRYELPDGGIWSVWYRYNDGSTKIASGIDNTVMTQTIDTYGVTMTVNNLYGVKDFYVAKGHYGTYREVKNADGGFGVTSTKIAGAHSFKYGAAIGGPGEYTACIRYDDANRADEFLYFTAEVEIPTVETFGKDITVGNIDDIRVIRVAPGTFDNVNAVKNADGVRNFTSGTIAKLGFTDSLTVNNAVDETGLDTCYTVSVEYRNLYTEIHNITLNKLIPEYTVSNGNITFTGLEGMTLLRYAPGTFTTASGIKNAPGSRYLHTDAVVNDTVSLDISGTYSFLVQYSEGSLSIFTLNIN